MSFLDDLLGGIKRVALLVSGVRTVAPAEPILTFTGVGVIVTDDPVNGQTIITIPAGGGGSGGNFALVEVQGTSTLQPQPGVSYLVASNAGTPGAVQFNDMTAIVSGGAGAHFYVKREDATGATNPVTVLAPSGHLIENPNSPGNFASQITMNTLSMSAEFFLRANGNLELR